MADFVQEKITDKIRKLLALAANNPHENEAALAAEKAQQLMREYNISLAQVVIMGEREKIDIGRRVIRPEFQTWMGDLAAIVAKYNNAQVVQLPMRVPGKRNIVALEFFATEGTIDSVIDTFNFLAAQLNLIAAVQTAIRTDVNIHGRVWKRSFLMGALNRLNSRLLEKQRSMATASASTALAVVNSNVDEAYHKAYPKLRAGKGLTNRGVNHNAYGKGIDAGNRLDIGGPTLGSNYLRLS